MKYTLISRNGKVYTFYVKAVAEMYFQLYGGNLITDQLYSEVYSELLV